MVPLNLLKSIVFLHNLEDFYLQRLASIAEVQDCPAGALIFRQGQQGSCIFLIVQGEVVLEVAVAGHPSVQIHTLGPGGLVGWSPLVGSGPMTATSPRAATVQGTAVCPQGRPAISA